MRATLLIWALTVVSVLADQPAQYYRPDLFVDAKFLKQQLDSRIIGGTDADIADFPFQLSLRVNGNHRCGGSIISTEWILSAAHCLGEFKYKPQQMSGDYGERD
jgi:secreted trypsin-like serine protease